ncbi:phosphonate ABC transporter, permease protein PhnE [Aliicoccus persicus]|uniref:Phosphonate transport system permease protein n=2 Tax=Aliicoccus persicus TaxID=930138 RepID=A0A662Z3Z1_9STAP|nr:phosphonate ABC transporter, permease protein PhnE [Aliicoccus persicus]SEW07643.1 phosphonate transport system permease protein [Aliicoccus persicus]
MENRDKVKINQLFSRKKKMYTAAILIILAAVYIVAFLSTPFTIRSSSVSTLETLRRLFIEPLINPEYYSGYLEMIELMLETIAIAYAGVTVATIIAVPVGFLAARNLLGPLSYLAKALLNAIRAIPELIFAIIFVASVGIGPYAGVLAISINSVGMIGKLYAEVIESIDEEPLEAIRASGGNRIQVIWYGVLPQVLPEFVSYSLYRFEIDVRASTVLGIVGAGGIGAPLILATWQRNWEDVGMILIVVVVFVSIIDILSGQIRKRLT